MRAYLNPVLCEIFQKEAAKASELRSKIHFVMEKEKNSRDEIVKLESELQKQKIEADKKLLAAQMDKIEAIDQLQQVVCMLK